MLQLFKPEFDNSPLPSPLRQHPILALLVEQEVIDQDQSDALLDEALDLKLPVPVILDRRGLMTGEEWANLVTEQYGVQQAESDDMPQEAVLPDVFSARFLRHNWLVPLVVEDETLWLAMADPSDENAIKAAKLASKLEVVPIVAPYDLIDQATSRLYDGSKAAFDEISAEEADDLDDDASDIEHLIDKAREAPIVRLVNKMFVDAINSGASDIHLEPFQDRLQVRYRIHGKMKEIASPPLKLAPAVISRVKILAKLDIAERRMPQDGRTQSVIEGRQIDMRVATAPTTFGETVVIRLLGTGQHDQSLSTIGLSQSLAKTLSHHFEAPHGMILVTGPTGSGKTTTLYAALSQMNAKDQKIISIEDPVERQISDVTQIQVQSEIGLDFARILRSVVRHDPNIIMVGETRDSETAEISVHAALTGHLLLSTLHTNTAAGAIARLIDMNVEPYLLASVLKVVIGQRLVGLLCPHCREPSAISPGHHEFLKQRGTPVQADARFCEPVGCAKCNNLGYTGRIGIFEILEVDNTIRDMIRHRATSQEIEDYARTKKGMMPMFSDGINKALAGLTSLDDVIRSA